MKLKSILVLALILSVVPLNVNASSDTDDLTAEKEVVEILGEEDRDLDAEFGVEIIESDNNSFTRMPSVVAGKSQVMAITVSSLSAGKYLTTTTNKAINPGKTLTYYAICTSRSSGSTAKVGFAYLNSSGTLIVQSTTTLSGYDSYGKITSNASYKNYGYVKNTGTSTLKASYVIMR